MKQGKIYFVGAGPGDPDLITVKGKLLIEEADVIVYAGSLVNPKLIDLNKKNAEIFDSAKMTLEEITDTMVKAVRVGKLIIRLQTGDLAYFSALEEQIAPLKIENIDYEVVPGVSSVNACSAVLMKEFTRPEISQTVIITRLAGRTPVPEKEKLSLLAKHNSTICIFLSAKMIDNVVKELKGSYSSTTPVSVVYKATWDDQKILRGNLSNIANLVKASGIIKHAIIIVGESIVDENTINSAKSKLYDKNFSHATRTSKS